MIKKILNINNWLSLILLPLGFLFFISIIILKPFIIIRFAPITSYRFGHYIQNIELYLCDKKLNGEDFSNSVNIFFLDTITCNSFLEGMCKRKIIIVPFQLLNLVHIFAKKISKKFSFIKKHLFDLRIYDYDSKNLLDKVDHQLKFTQKEIELGDRLLEKLGIKKNDKIVCFSNRDDEYMKKNLLGKYNESHKWNIRNSNVQTYSLAAKELSKRGYTVVRMGKDTKDNINFGNEKIIDYSKSKLRSDFLDIYLAYRCEFAFGDSSGWSVAPKTFRKYFAFVNWVPFSELHYYSKKYLFIFKHYYDEKSKKKLNINEIFERKLHNKLSQELREKKITLIDNSPEEILELVLEAESKYTGKFKYTNEYISINSNFKKFLIKNNFLKEEYNNTFELTSNSGFEFLSSNFDLANSS